MSGGSMNTPKISARSNTRGTLARSVVLNLAGQGAPLIAALFAIPLLIPALGTERFGVLIMAWLVIGYLSLFDLGLGRALTKLVAERLATGTYHEISPLVATALVVMTALGCVVGLLLALITPWLVADVLKIDRALRSETTTAFYLLAGAVPFVVVAAGLRGVLEAFQRFGLVNAVRVPMGLLMFIGPVLALPFSTGLPAVVAVLVVVRALTFGAYLLLCVPLVPELRAGGAVRVGLLRELLDLGTWITVSNVVSPLMVYLDRFLIGAILSVSAVAYYATPYEVVTKLWLIPGAFASVLFPAFAASLLYDVGRARLLYSAGVRLVFLAVFPCVLLFVTFAGEGLELWLGGEFARNGAVALQWLAVGVLFNSVAQIPFALLQSAGHADLTAKLHLVELPLYLGAVWWLIEWHGIAGAALAWTLRTAFDCAVLFVLGQRLLPSAHDTSRSTLLWVLLSALALAVGAWLSAPGGKALYVVLALAAFWLFAWRVALTPAERDFVRHPLRTALGEQ
jgi:O-antigen/teichoic acid export membrane protein